MSGELMQYMNGSAPVERRERRVVKGAKRIHDEVRTAAFKADGAMALAGHIGEGVIGLHNHFQKLAGEDVFAATLLGEVFQETMHSVTGIQRDLYSGWKL